MARRCTIYAHKARADIDQALIEHRPYRAIGIFDKAEKADDWRAATDAIRAAASSG